MATATECCEQLQGKEALIIEQIGGLTTLIDSLKDTIATLTSQLAECNESGSGMVQQITDLTDQLADMTNQRDALCTCANEAFDTIIAGIPQFECPTSGPLDNMMQAVGIWNIGGYVDVLTNGSTLSVASNSGKYGQKYGINNRSSAVQWPDDERATGFRFNLYKNDALIGFYQVDRSTKANIVEAFENMIFDIEGSEFTAADVGTVKVTTQFVHEIGLCPEIQFFSMTWTV